MTARAPLADRVAATDFGALLPVRLPTDSAVRPRRLRLVAEHRLGVGLWLMLLESAGSRYAAPVVDDGLRLRRAAAGDGAAEALIRVLEGGDHARSPFHWTQLRAVAPMAGERAMGVDQTHESLVVGERAVVKWMVRAEATPAPLVVAHLSETGFSAMPPAWGYVTYGEAPHRIALAAVTEFLPGASDGWRWCVDDVGRVSRGETADAVGRQAPSALGRLVADLHASLATPSSVQPSPVRSVDAVEVGRWSEHAHRLLAEALETVTGPEGQRLRERRQQIEKAIELRHVDDCLTMPIHGDLHVGQVLRWDGGYAINDFDGNPVLATAERAQPQPAARDVAGMMQSLDHVGRVVMRRVEDADPTRTQEWIQAAQRDFLLSYARRLAHSGHEHLLEPRLLMPFRVEQELREYLYAERHLPRWRYVPDGAVTAMFAKEQ